VPIRAMAMTLWQHRNLYREYCGSICAVRPTGIAGFASLYRVSRAACVNGAPYRSSISTTKLLILNLGTEFGSTAGAPPTDSATLVVSEDMAASL
jgi:hypothetical protein